MTIIFRILTTLIFLVSTPFIALGVLVVGLMAIWGKAKPKAKPAPPEKTEHPQVPLTSDGAAMRNIEWDGYEGEVGPID